MTCSNVANMGGPNARARRGAAALIVREVVAHLKFPSWAWFLGISPNQWHALSATSLQVRENSRSTP